jgi:hypothetical protein
MVRWTSLAFPSLEVMTGAPHSVPPSVAPPHHRCFTDQKLQRKLLKLEEPPELHQRITPSRRHRAGEFFRHRAPQHFTDPPLPPYRCPTHHPCPPVASPIHHIEFRCGCDVPPLSKDD